MASIFLTGGTGYMGAGLAAELLARGHRVQILVRPGSEHKGISILPMSLCTWSAWRIRVPLKPSSFAAWIWFPSRKQRVQRLKPAFTISCM